MCALRRFRYVRGGGPMSITALNWAFSAKVKSSNAKFILVALSNYADEAG